ncbi:MAG: hypothetical protein ACRC1P_03740 [Cellulosilyticaceae bacterium]
MKKGSKILVGIVLGTIINLGVSSEVGALQACPQIGSGCCGYSQVVEVTIPKLTSIKQISPNQIEIMYDTPVDLTAGTKVSNYWVRSKKDNKAKGIATLGKKDKVSADNALTSDKVSIQAVEGSDNRLILTFSSNIGKGEAYELIICYVTAPGAAAYNGDNGMGSFVGK